MSPRLSIKRLRASKAGHSQEGYVALLKSLGYELVRHTRHGARLSHPELRRHPDLIVRRDKSWLLIPVGRRLPEYVAEDVLESVAILEKVRKESMNA